MGHQEGSYTLSYGKKHLEFCPEKGRVVFCAKPQKTGDLLDTKQLVQQALNQPIASPPLEELVKEGNTVTIIVDDITRPTPRKLLLGAVCKRLECRRNVQILIVLALGTHRIMTPQEIQEDLGEFARRYPVINVDYRDTSRFVQVATMPDGTPVQVYREVMQADVIVGIGNIVPHIAAGWGGGAKIVMPGVCGKETTDAIHMLSCLKQNVLKTCGNTENLFRETMEMLAAKVGLSFIINTVIDEERNVLRVFCGHFVQAHREGVQFARKVLCPQIPCRADILVVSANPANADFWQGAKPFVFAHSAVKQGGVIVFLLSAEEGLCGGAPVHEQTIRRYYTKSERYVLEALKRNETTDVLGLGETFIRLQTENICHTILVSDGLNKEDAALLGFEKAKDLDSAMKMAFARMGEDATIGIIPEGGDLLCVADPECGA